MADFPANRIERVAFDILTQDGDPASPLAARIFPFLKAGVRIDLRDSGRSRGGAVELASTKIGQVGKSAGILTLREVHRRDVDTNASTGNPNARLAVFDAQADDRRYWNREVPVTLVGHVDLSRKLVEGEVDLMDGLLIQRSVGKLPDGLSVFEDAHWIPDLVGGVEPMNRKFTVEPEITLVAGL